MPCHTDDTHGTSHHHGYSCDTPGFQTESMIYHICHTYKAGCQDVISYVLPVCWHHYKHKTYLQLSNTVTLNITRTVMYLVKNGVFTAVLLKILYFFKVTCHWTSCEQQIHKDVKKKWWCLILRYYPSYVIQKLRKII